MVYGSPDVTTKYGYDGAQVIEEYDVNNTRLRRYFYGPNIDEPLAMIDHTGGNKMYYYHFDPLGSVVALSDVNGILVERYEYDVYGEPTIYDANDTVISESSVGNPYMFTGRRYDTETGLYYYRARYYNPDIGRFLEPDPIGYYAGLNLYTYVGNDPINRIDPLGLFFPGQGMMMDRKPKPQEGDPCCKEEGGFLVDEEYGGSLYDCINNEALIPATLGAAIGLGSAFGGELLGGALGTTIGGIGVGIPIGDVIVAEFRCLFTRKCRDPGTIDECGNCK